MTKNSAFPNSRKKSAHLKSLKFHNCPAELEISRHDRVKNHRYIPPDNMAQNSGEYSMRISKTPIHEEEVNAELKQHLLNNRGISSTGLKGAELRDGRSLGGISMDRINEFLEEI